MYSLAASPGLGVRGLFRVGRRLPSTTELLVFRNDGELDLE